MTYEELYADWKYLFKRVGCADDMTGAYVDSEDLDDLLKSPTKATAKKCLNRQIDYWFQTGIQFDDDLKGKSIFDLIEDHPKIKEIAERHCADLENCPDPFVKPC
ncbi:hypothetical protein ACPF3S_003166 [Vibrio cholerae]|uniref:hypothetical protein n=1 Tax=Vibrio cholerae TaxID=666 RepID=UPI000E0B0F0C|nr:hypothetical protein [Vibrio cholerae]EGQ7707458.1 hypothetical protein [Vibrio cholerae]EGR5063478.1 hypothetical protein [Vibrio cholerae]EKF9501226.1 hypothetical protein [Vibrio cholerae]QKU65586.1 hypothetical protein HPY17_19905 [Vibrio cholerae]HAS5006716.1 hypothetical protein [Vibrio cholerae]